MAQELVAHPVSGKPAVKVIRYTDEGEKIDYEERELRHLQQAVDQAYDEYNDALESAKEVQRRAEQMVREATRKVDEVETRLADCKSELERGEAITADPGAFQGTEAASSPSEADVSGTAGTGFGLPH